jgi:hypothetical protein
MTQYRKYLMASSTILAMNLAACGGGGSGGGVESLPPPPPLAATSFPSIITAASASQEFSTRGASYASPQVFESESDVSNPSLADNSQMDVRYNAASKTYEIQLPADSAWQPIAPAATYPPPSDNLFLYRGGAPDHVGVFDHRSDLQYSALLEWFTDTSSGFSAIGIATPPGAVPIAGSASYAGSILGASSETHFDKWEAAWLPGRIGGDINLSFNFGSGTLSGNVNPTLFLGTAYSLPSLNFTSTIYSNGSTTFSGTFGSALAGQNSFSGLFTGPNAQELIGNFAFPYASPLNGATQQAAGAFAGRKH